MFAGLKMQLQLLKKLDNLILAIPKLSPLLRILNQLQELEFKGMIFLMRENIMMHAGLMETV